MPEGLGKSWQFRISVSRNSSDGRDDAMKDAAGKPTCKNSAWSECWYGCREVYDPRLICKQFLLILILSL